jgi:uncharacterized membrane protein
MGESRKRSIMKTLSWRIIATLITFTIAYLLTSEIRIATGIGIFDAIVKMAGYYAHERLWLRNFSFGLKKNR